MIFSLAIGILAQTLPALSKVVTSDQGEYVITPRQNVQKNVDFMLLQIVSQRKSNLQKYHSNKPRKFFPSQRNVLDLELQGETIRNIPNNNLWKSSSQVQDCDPTSTDADIGILSCGEGYYCMPFPSRSSHGGICAPIFDPSEQDSNVLGTSADGDNTIRTDHGFMNGLPTALTVPNDDVLVVPCDPTWIDLGILACKDDEFCLKDKSSDLGGFCTSKSAIPSTHASPSSRFLYSMDDFIEFCDPVTEQHPGTCDCSGLNITSGNGTIYCQNKNVSMGYLFDGCGEIVLDRTYLSTFQNSVATGYRCCYNMQLPAYEGVCITWYGEHFTERCKIEWNGQECQACRDKDYFVDFDCSNIVPGRVGSTTLELSTVLQECYTKPKGNSTCINLCSDGDSIPDTKHDINVTVGDLGELSCGYLAIQEEYALIPDADCEIFMIAAQSGCCETLNSTTTNPPEQEGPGETEPPSNEENPPPDSGSTAARVAIFQSIRSVTDLVNFCSLAITTVLILTSTFTNNG